MTCHSCKRTFIKTEPSDNRQSLKRRLELRDDQFLREVVYTTEKHVTNRIRNKAIKHYNETARLEK